MPEIQLPNSKVRVLTYEPAPPDFDPLTASQRQLLRHGYPARPDPKREPDLLKRFRRLLSRKVTYITPTFRRIEGRRHKPPGRSKTAGTRLRKSKTAGPYPSDTSAHWSGSVVFAPTGGSFGCIMGEWTVPNTYAVYQDGWYYAAEWVGIDGWGSSDVLQAGTETDAFWAYGWRDTYAWWEWFPEYQVAITNFPVSPGDVMLCMIAVISPTRASIYLKNESNSVGTSFTITAPSGTSLVGNCAEWIVERPDINGHITWLADFEAVYFDIGVAGYDVGPARSYVLLGSGTLVTMVGAGGKSLSVPIKETDELMKVVWEASR